MDLENINLSEDKIGRLPFLVLWYRLGFLSSAGYILCQQCTFQPHVNFICTLDLEVFNFSEKITCFAFYLMLWTEFSTCQSTNLKRRWPDFFFCNYYHIQCVCNHSTALVVIFCCNLSFCHIFVTSKIFSLCLETYMFQNTESNVIPLF
jgi:hypothetical protein